MAITGNDEAGGGTLGAWCLGWVELLTYTEQAVGWFSVYSIVLLNWFVVATQLNRSLDAPKLIGLPWKRKDYMLIKIEADECTYNITLQEFHNIKGYATSKLAVVVVCRWHYHVG